MGYLANLCTGPDMQRVLLIAATELRAGPGAAAAASGWRILLYALLAGAAAELPAWLHGASTSWAWAVLGACVGVVAGCTWGRGAAHGSASHPWLACILATSAGTVADFAATPPQALLDLCAGVAGFGTTAISEHLRGLPTTTWVTLPVLIAARLGARRQAGAAPSSPAYARALLSIVGEFGAMQALMLLGVEAARAFALQVGLSWTCDAISASMMAGMLVSFQAQALAARLMHRPARAMH